MKISLFTLSLRPARCELFWPARSRAIALAGKFLRAIADHAARTRAPVPQPVVPTRFNAWALPSSSMPLYPSLRMFIKAPRSAPWPYPRPSKHALPLACSLIPSTLAQSGPDMLAPLSPHPPPLFCCRCTPCFPPPCPLCVSPGLTPLPFPPPPFTRITPLALST